MPGINITFKESIKSFAPNFTRGVVAVLLRETGVDKTVEINSAANIPAEITGENLEFVKLVMSGSPTKVICFIYSDSLGSDHERYEYDVVCGAGDAASAVAGVVATANADKRPCLGVAVASTGENMICPAPNGSIELNDEKVISAEQWCGQLAGMVASCKLNSSLTRAVLPGVKSVPQPTSKEIADATSNNQIILINDKGVVKIHKAVMADGTSVKTAYGKNILTNMLYSTLSDRLGQTLNNYNNRCFILGDIIAGLRDLSNQGVIDGEFIADFDLEAIANALGDAGKDMTADQLRVANTGEQMYVKITGLQFTGTIDVVNIVIGN